jgi:TonB family protein
VSETHEPDSDARSPTGEARRARSRGDRWRWPLLLLFSVVFHAAIAPYTFGLFQGWHVGNWETPVSVRFIDGDALDALTPDQLANLLALEERLAEEAPAEEPEEPEPELPDGQVVDTPPPDLEKVPLTAEYLAEHDNAVPQETRTEAYRVNPEVISNMFSREEKLAFEDVIDVGATEVSSGATVGNMGDPAPGKGAPRSIIPSPWALTNKEGLASPTRSSSKEQSLAGAPQNDRLDEKLGSSVALNTREFIGAQYINRIKQQVNFYWSQNVDNLPSSVRLSKPAYSTVVAVVLTGDGALEGISVTTDSGQPPLDNAVVEAFRIAGPFPNPPVQLIKKDGRVYLSDLSFTVTVGHARMDYGGIDPRAGVQFPGILKSPR